MKDFIRDFADVASELNRTIPAFSNQGNTYSPGIGPYSENEIVSSVIGEMNRIGMLSGAHVLPTAQIRSSIGLEGYSGLNSNAAIPDLVIGDRIIEFKICRPLRDNGAREDTWFKKVFEPSPGSYSTFLDVEKLCRFRQRHDSEGRWQGWVIIIGYERRDETEYRLDLYFPNLYRMISEEIVGRPYLEFLSETRDMGDRHPFHRVLKLYAFRY
jgi:hypothetical protein